MGKRIDGCYNVFAWINNGFWGTLCLVGGIYGMFWGQNFWMGVVGIALGVYFFWTKSMTRKTLAVIAGDDPELPAAAPGAATADQPAAPAVTTPAGPFGRTTPPGSVSRRKTVLKNVFMVASLVFLVLGARALSMDEENIGTYMVVYGGLGLACFFVYARITVHRATEDALPALPWGGMIVAVLIAAFSPNARHVPYTTQEGAAAAAEKAAHPVDGAAQPAGQPATNAVVSAGSVTKRKLIIRNAIMFAGLVIMFLGVRAIKDDIGSLFTLLLMYGIPTAALLLLASRVRFDRATEDVQPAAPWGETIAATLKGAFAPRAQAVAQVDASATAPEAAGADVLLAVADSPTADAGTSSPGVEHALAAGDGAVRAATSRGKSAVGWFSSLTGNAKAGVVAGAIVLVFVAGFLVANATTRSSSAGASTNASSTNNPGGTGGDYTPTADTSSPSSSDSAAGQDGASSADSAGNSGALPAAERKTLQDLLATANEDGSQIELTGYWDGKEIAKTGQLVFIPSEGDHPPTFVLVRDDSWSTNIGGGSQPMSLFLEALSATDMTFGTVAYTKDGIVYLDAKPDGDI